MASRKWTAVFAVPRGFSGRGERIMEQNVADWVSEQVDAKAQNLLESFMVEHKRDMAEAEAVIAMQNDTLETRFEKLQTAEKTIAKLVAESEILKERIVELEVLTEPDAVIDAETGEA